MAARPGLRERRNPACAAIGPTGCGPTPVKRWSNAGQTLVKHRAEIEGEEEPRLRRNRAHRLRPTTGGGGEKLPDEIRTWGLERGRVRRFDRLV